MDIRLDGTFTTRSGLSHIGESISTQTFLVEEPISQPDDTIALVFCYGGNAWRGQLRDLMASYMLHHIGDPRIGLDAFHLLYTGGRIGGDQTIDVRRIRQVRGAIPLVSLLGGGIGSMLLPGKLAVHNCYPVCIEARPVLLDDRGTKLSYRSLTMEKSFSRKDDSKDPRVNAPILPSPETTQGALLPAGDEMIDAAKERRESGPADQMRMTSELLIPGVILETAIVGLDLTEVELGCLVSGLHTFAKAPYLGGQRNRGHGLVDLTYHITDLDTGERQDFISVRGGLAQLAPAAAEAKAAYDDHLKHIYDLYLSDNSATITTMLNSGKVA